MNGPVPTGWRAYAEPAAFTAVGELKPKNDWPSSPRNGANGFEKVNLTVMSSTASTFSSGPMMPFDGEALFGSRIVSNRNFTALALNGGVVGSVVAGSNLKVPFLPAPLLAQGPGSHGLGSPFSSR